MAPCLSVRHQTYSSVFATHLTLRPIGLNSLCLSYSGPNPYVLEVALICHLLSVHCFIYTFKFTLDTVCKYNFQFSRHKTRGQLTQNPCGCHSPVPVETSVETQICLQKDRALVRQCLCCISPFLWHRNVAPEQQPGSQVGWLLQQDQGHQRNELV